MSKQDKQNGPVVKATIPDPRPDPAPTPATAPAPETPPNPNEPEKPKKWADSIGALWSGECRDGSPCLRGHISPDGPTGRRMRIAIYYNRDKGGIATRPDARIYVRPENPENAANVAAAAALLDPAKNGTPLKKV